jgi:hypothetical protein
MQVSGNGYEQLNQAIEGASFQLVPMKSKSDMVDYYQAHYPARGTGSWRDMLARDLSSKTGTKYNSIRRQLDPDRLARKPVRGSKNEQGYIDLGKQLPPKKEPKNTSGKRARVSFSGEVCIPSGKKRKDDCRPREFTTTLSASQASSMKHGNFNPIFDAYGLEPGVIGSIDVYSMSVDFV